MKIDLANLTITKAHKHLVDGDFSATELAEAYLSAIEKKNPELNAFLGVYDDVLEQAKRVENQNVKDKGSLWGIPIALKDNILVKGKEATAASKILKGYHATYDATVTKKLKEAGALLLGRTNLDEFAMGASTENSAFGPTKNPHDTTRVAGGSSGGSTAAVAAGLACAALGSDTAGSIRQPSAFCGTVGLKPTYGSVSRSGLIALGSSLDVIGPITKTVSDAETIFNVIKGKDPMDSTTVDESDYPTTNDKLPTTNYAVGVPRAFLDSTKLDVRVRKNFDESVERLKSLGHIIKDIELPNLRYAVPAYYILLPAEASANLARFDGVKYGHYADGDDLLGDYLRSRGEGFGPEPRRRILIGTYVLSAGYYDAYYGKAQAVRRLIADDFARAFQSVDVIAMPTAAGPAFKIGEKAKDPVQMYLEDIFTVPANHAGLPALTVPSGVVEEAGTDLPVGLQLYAPHMGESRLFSLGKQFLGE